MLVPLFTPNLTDYKVTAELTCIFIGHLSTRLSRSNHPRCLSVIISLHNGDEQQQEEQRYYWHNISQIFFDVQQAAKDEEHADVKEFFLSRNCLNHVTHNINT